MYVHHEKIGHWTIQMAISCDDILYLTYSVYIYLFIICIKYKQAKCNTYNKCSNLFLNDLSGLFSHDSTRGGTEELDCQWPQRWQWRRRPLEAEGTWTFSICFQKKHVTRTRKKPWTLFLELLGKRNFSPLKS